MSELRGVDTTSAATTGTAAAGAPAWMTILIGGIELALPIDAVAEVVPTPDVLPVPMTPAWVAGVVTVRADVVPVVDLGLRLLDRAASRTGRLVILTVAGSDERVAVLVDAVSGLIPRANARVDAGAEAAPGVDPRFLAGAVAHATGRAVAILDVAVLLDSSASGGDT